MVYLAERPRRPDHTRLDQQYQQQQVTTIPAKLSKNNKPETGADRRDDDLSLNFQ